MVKPDLRSAPGRLGGDGGGKTEETGEPISSGRSVIDQAANHPRREVPPIETGSTSLAEVPALEASVDGELGVVELDRLLDLDIAVPIDADDSAHGLGSFDEPEALCPAAARAPDDRDVFVNHDEDST